MTDTTPAVRMNPGEAINSALGDEIATTKALEALTAAGWVFAHKDALAAAPVAPGGEGDRETIARIINPDGWATRDRQHREIAGLFERGLMTEAEAERARKSSDAYASQSLDKADRILAALRARSEPDAGAVALLQQLREAVRDYWQNGDPANGYAKWVAICDALQAYDKGAHPAPSDPSATERMRAALEPFIEAAKSIRPDDPDGDRPAIVQVRHFRALIAALGEA